MTSPSDSVLYVDLHNRLGEMAFLMERSWKDNKDQPLEYSEAFLRSCLEYPGGRPSLAVGVTAGGELAGCVAGFPRRVSLRAHELHLLLMTFFTVAPERKGQGLGVRVWAECVRQAAAAGYHGTVHYCVDGNKSNAVTVAGARAAGQEAQRVFSVPYQMRFLRPAPPPDPVRWQECAELLIHSSAGPAGRADLVRLWSPPEARWQCRERLGAVCQSLESGGRRGALTGYVLCISDTARTPCLFIEDILWDDLGAPDRVRLLELFLAQAASEGAQLAAVPLLGYAEMEPFQALRFRRSTRLLHCYLTLWNVPARQPVAEFAGLYLDLL